MTDRELLELAAKAAGKDSRLLPFDLNDWKWNPLTDDGDALRLAHKLGLLSDVPVWPKTLEETRRAIVCAAAEIGKALP